MFARTQARLLFKSGGLFRRTNIHEVVNYSTTPTTTTANVYECVRRSAVLLEFSRMPLANSRSSSNYYGLVIITATREPNA